MPSYQKLCVLLLSPVVGAGIIKATTPESRSQATAPKQEIKPDLKKFFAEFPIVDLNAPEPSGPDERGVEPELSR